MTSRKLADVTEVMTSQSNKLTKTGPISNSHPYIQNKYDLRPNSEVIEIIRTSSLNFALNTSFSADDVILCDDVTWHMLL